jgi:hypothetical protein
VIAAHHDSLGKFRFIIEQCGASPPPLLFTDNETNSVRVFGVPNTAPYVKDAFHRFVIENDAKAVNPAAEGTKAAAHVRLTIPPGEEVVLRMRLRPESEAGEKPFGPAFDAVFRDRVSEADQFLPRNLAATAHQG